MEFEPIGIIHTPWTEAPGTPIQPAAAGSAEGHADIDPQYAAGLKDLAGFDRIWLVYIFDRVSETRLTVTPFMDDAARGVFATRAPCRPNPIGISCVRLVRVAGTRLHLREVDMLDGTPLLDIKPYAPQFDRYTVERVGWLSGKSPQGRTADDRFAGGKGENGS